MIDRISSLINIFDVGDLKFFFLVAKKKSKKFINSVSNIFFIGFFNFIKSREKIPQ